MKIIGTSIVSVIPIWLIIACGGGSSGQPTNPPSKEAEELKKKVYSLEWDVRLLTTRVETLESGHATVSAEDQGYDVARTKFGPFTVSARSATPYLDGYKVKLRVGNLTNANFNGARLSFAWGPPYDPKNLKEWKEGQKKKEMNVTNRLASGSFTDLEVVLTPAKPEEVKSFTVGFEFDQLELRVR